MELLRKGILLAGVVMCLLPCPVSGGEKLIAEINRYRENLLRVDQGGEIWSAYYDPKGMLHIRGVEGGKDFAVNSEKSGASGLALDVQGRNLVAVWREKGDRKRLFSRAVRDGKTLSETVLIDDGKTAPLSRIKIASDKEGNVAVAWYGETVIKGNKDHLYVACSSDSGDTFSKPQNLTLGYRYAIYPTVLSDDRKTYVFSYAVSPRGQMPAKKYMLFRKSVDGCKTWSDPVEIKEIGVVNLFMQPMKSGNRLHVLWLTSYEGVPVVEGAYSDDEGATWKTTVIESTRGFALGVMRFANDSKGHIYVAVDGKKKGEEKATVYIVRSEDNGTTWSEMVPLRHYSSKHTQAEHVIVRAEDDGTVIAVWQDFRNIRSNLYMQYSKDYGKTWQEKDIPLEEPGRFNAGLFPYTANIVKAKDKYYMPLFRLRSDDLAAENADLFLLDFTLDKGEKEK